MLQSKVQLAPIMKNVIMAVLIPKSVIQLTAFTAFETGRKLNYVCCNYVHYFHQPIFLPLERGAFPSLLSDNSDTMHRFIFFMRTNQDQIFDDDIDYKCYVKNLLRFFKVCVRYFLSNFYFSPNDSPSKTMKNAFYFI